LHVDQGTDICSGNGLDGAKLCLNGRVARNRVGERIPVTFGEKRPQAMRAAIVSPGIVVQQWTGEAKPNADITGRPHHCVRLVDKTIDVEGVVAMHCRADAGLGKSAKGDKRFEIGIRSRPQPEPRYPHFKRVVGSTEIKGADAVAMIVCIDR